MSDGTSFRLDGKVAVVTGAGRGIGAAIAVAMADAGADVALVSRSAAELGEVADEIRARGRRAAVIVDDLSGDVNVRAMVDEVVRQLGTLDVLVNNAGGASPGAFVEASASQLDEAFHFNVSVPFELLRAAVPHLLQGDGSTVINVSSNLGHLAARGYVVYGTVKAAVSHLTRLLSVDLAPWIRVNAVAPSVVDTAAVAPRSPTKCASTSSRRPRLAASHAPTRSHRPSSGSPRRHRATW